MLGHLCISCANVWPQYKESTNAEKVINMKVPNSGA